MQDQVIEQEIQAKGLTAPRITPADVEANIDSERYFTAGDGVHGATLKDGNSHCVYESSLDLLTFCVLVLRNGFTVTGESACASPENFDAEIGRKIARQNAIAKVWPLMGYLLKERLRAESQLNEFYANCGRRDFGPAGVSSDQLGAALAKTLVDATGHQLGIADDQCEHAANALAAAEAPAIPLLDVVVHEQEVQA